MSKVGAIYYSDFHCEPDILEVCKENLKRVFRGNIVSVTLNKGLDLGDNLVFHGDRSNTMMVAQILAALKASDKRYVFFCEHDVLYDPSHFDFVPPRDDTFYYDTNFWRWDFPNDRIITYDNLTSLSMMCCNREFAVDHYTKRLLRIIGSGWWKEDGIGMMQPLWVRKLGYEPGTKRRKIGGFSDDVSERYRSAHPTIDIRHNRTLSNPKVHLHQFKHLPKNFTEQPLSVIKNFDLKRMFNL